MLNLASRKIPFNNQNKYAKCFMKLFFFYARINFFVYGDEIHQNIITGKYPRKEIKVAKSFATDLTVATFFGDLTKRKQN